MTKRYTNRSNCNRAARKALGDDAISGVDFIITQHGPRSFTWEAANQLPADREPAPAETDLGKAARVAAEQQAEHDAKHAPAPCSPDRLAKAREASRASAAAKREQAQARKAAAKPAATAPREGTKMRLIFDMMRRDGGATAKELCAAVGIEAGWWVDCRKWADKYGLKAVRSEDTVGNRKYARYELKDRAE